jgi:[ribosomal protein S5]-alanine N-acetyltransferase
MQLRGERCIVRPWRLDDAESLAAQANNSRIARQLRDRFPHPYTRRDAAEFLQRASVNAPSADFAIEIQGRAAGGIGFVRGGDIERYTAEIGYWLGEPFWGRGAATEAVALVTAHAFEQWGLLRMFALPFADNAASRRVLEKGGYTCEGILRASCVKFGEPRDQALYARINEKWAGPRE